MSLNVTGIPYRWAANACSERLQCPRWTYLQNAVVEKQRRVEDINFAFLQKGGVHALTTNAAALTDSSRDLSRSAAMAAAAADDISIASSKSLELKGSFT